MYHDVVRGDGSAGGFARAGAGRYSLHWDAFVDHLEAIARVVGEPPSVTSDIIGAAPASPVWLLTFDDGGASAADIGEELGRRGWRGHFFVTTGRIGAAGFLEENAIIELHRMGHVIGSHSVTHPARMSSLSFAELMDEWQASTAKLSELVGEAVRTASIPGGSYSRAVARAAERSGIDMLFTSEPVQTTRVIDGLLVFGRYAIRRETRSQDAAAAAAGRATIWLRQYAAWNLRKPLKTIAGDRYTWARRAIGEARLARRAR
jgi:peptidoglycan/xylan/chitin deacetylase (PgdA/CDA1 family)